MISSKDVMIAVVLLAVRPVVAEEDRKTAADRNLKTMMELVQTVELYDGPVAAQERLVRKPPVQRWSNPIGISIPDAKAARLLSLRVQTTADADGRNRFLHQRE